MTQTIRQVRPSSQAHWIASVAPTHRERSGEGCLAALSDIRGAVDRIAKRDHRQRDVEGEHVGQTLRANVGETAQRQRNTQEALEASHQ